MKAAEAALVVVKCDGVVVRGGAGVTEVAEAAQVVVKEAGWS